MVIVKGKSNLPSLNGLTAEVEVKGVSEDEETLIISIRCVRLELNLVFLKQVPVVTVLKAGLHENAILVSGEVLATDDLPNEEHLWLEVCPCAQLAAHLLHLINLLLLHVFQSLLLGVKGDGVILIAVFVSVIEQLRGALYRVLLVVLARIGIVIAIAPRTEIVDVVLIVAEVHVCCHSICFIN